MSPCNGFVEMDYLPWLFCNGFCFSCSVMFTKNVIKKYKVALVMSESPEVYASIALAVVWEITFIYIFTTCA